MPIDLSTVVSSTLTYLNMALPVFLLTPRDSKSVKHFNSESFQHTLQIPEQVNPLFRGTDFNIVIARGATPLIHRHDMALQLPWLKREEWP
jgi:hypothetical protein